MDHPPGTINEYEIDYLNTRFRSSLTLGSNTTMDLIAAIDKFEVGEKLYLLWDQNQTDFLGTDNHLQFSAICVDGEIVYKIRRDDVIARVQSLGSVPRVSREKGEPFTNTLENLLRLSTASEYDPIFLHHVSPHLIGPRQRRKT